MRDSVPIIVIVSFVAAAILLMLWAIYRTNYSEQSTRLPPAEVSRDAAPPSR
jgi:hypothetical protein